jgi:hypothetical protein
VFETFNNIIANESNKDIHIFNDGISFNTIAVNIPNVKVAIPNPIGRIAQ